MVFVNYIHLTVIQSENVLFKIPWIRLGYQGFITEIWRHKGMHKHILKVP